jgi:hypothetical protein
VTRIDIGRLAIDAPHLSADDGERLARRVAEGLRSEVPLRDHGSAVDAMRVAVNDQGGGIDALAEAIVADLLRQIGRE